ncbi:MAG: RNA-binding transcriptional accessory protein [Elusimicrobia bacterium]|nr:RNA-binding transcriptional accessory protein [Candidatus Liberimonas magnetica]
MEGALFVINNIVKDVDKPLDSVVNTVVLLEGGATIPFIARYRKEKTGNLDETVIRKISDRLEYYRELEGRKDTIIKSIEAQKKMTPELKKKILDCADKATLEDMYLPYKPRIRTRATVAKEKGLEPLADIMMSLEAVDKTKQDIAAPFLNKEKEVETYEQAINGAKDIIAERIADMANVRGWIRNYTAENGVLQSGPRKDYKDTKTKYSTYYDTSELIKTAPSHRILAIRRGTKEEVLSWKILVDEKHITDQIKTYIFKAKNLFFKPEIAEAIEDSYSRLMALSISVEVFMQATQKAEEEAINVFSKNLRNLLLAPPAGSKITIGIDPGYRTGCKIAVVDEKGDFKEFNTIYPTPPENDDVGSEAVLMDLIEEYEPELIAIGNGTGSKETDQFVKGLIKKHNLKLSCVMVSEAGASVYSASETAGKEYPDLDVTARGAISIAHRLQDPLAELVKIDPKAIGVGQYQHDVNQKELKRSLELTVESCVNYVGVDLNTASTELLSYVSGIGRALAENLVAQRSENGKFTKRDELSKVPKLSPKVFEQCAGFLRIRNSENPLDNSSIHPESYPVVEKMAKDMNATVKDLISNKSLVDSIKIDNYVTDTIGLLTLKDIIAELKKPGRDPRKEFSSVEFSSEINNLEDLSPGMILTGTVTNVANFGAFVDIGVHQDGLIHISMLADVFVKNPYDIVAVGDTVSVEVIEIDTELNRIALKRLSGGKGPNAGRFQGKKEKGKGKGRDADQGFKIGSYLDNSFSPPKED